MPIELIISEKPRNNQTSFHGVESTSTSTTQSNFAINHDDTNQIVSESVKIYLYTLCFNEEFIIPYFLQHYAYVDKIFVYDNGSTDQSLALLSQDPRCTIIPFQSHFDDKINRYIKNNCWKKHRGQCDYVIVCDMDEFLFTGVDLRKYLQTLKDAKKSYDIFKIRGFQMVSTRTDLDPTISLTEQVKDGIPSQSYSKNIIFNPNRVQEINYSMGAHHIQNQKYFRWGPLLYLLHFKFIGGMKRVCDRYLTLKNRLSASNIKNGFGLHYLKSPKQEYEQLIATSKQIVR